MELEFAAQSSRPMEVIGGTIAKTWSIEFEDNAQTVDDMEDCILPAPFPHFELFSMRIKFATKIPTELHGTITLIDSDGELDLYTRLKGDCNPIHPDIDLLLTGPHRNIVAGNPFVISVNLEDNNRQDCEPCTTFSWDPLESSHAYYDLPLSTTLKCPFGSVTLNWSMFGYGTGAHVEVMLLRINNVDDGENENENLPASADIYGRITAQNSMFKSNIESVLFQKTPEDKSRICVRPGKPIPLLRSVVALPATSSLILQLDLWDANHMVSIAMDSVEFPAQSKGTSKKNISSSYGEIQVKLTWERS